MKKDKNYSEVDALEDAVLLYGGLKELKINSMKPSKNITQTVTRLIRHMHGKYFTVIPSVAAEKVANECGMSFVNARYNQSYSIANKMNESGCNPLASKLFHREHIEGGCKRISSYLLNNVDQWNSGKDMLDWLHTNTFVVLRLKSEADLIHEESSLLDISQLIVK